MSGPFGAGALNFFSGAAEFYPYTIDQSVRFNAADSAYLQKTFSTTGDEQIFTISFWFKRCRTGTAEYLFSGGNDVSNRFHMDINASGTFQIEGKSGGSTQVKMEGGPVLRDVGAWYHFVLRVDTTQATASDRVRLYVNGDLLTFNSNTYPSQNANLNWNINDQVRIGLAGWNTSTHFDGYFAEFINVDGSSLAPTSFGETKAGIWIPKDYTGSYGTNGFKLAFQDSASLGDDTSGNGHDFTSSGLTSTDQMPDTPTNNFMTFNPLNRSGSSVSFAEGNLRFNSGGTGGPPYNYAVAANFSGSQSTGGKYYWEWYCLEAGFAAVGIFDSSVLWDGGSKINGDGPVVYYAFDGKFANQTARVTYGDTFTDGDLIGCAVDFDSRKIWFSKNGTWQNSGDPATGTGEAGTFADEEYFLGYVEAGSSTDLTKIILNAGQDSTFAGNLASGGNADAKGIGDFKYSVPSGYLALCAANLPDPGIDPAEDEAPEDYFNTVTYTGVGGQSITGVGFQPDWVWIKSRNVARDHKITDSVRGVNKELGSHTSAAEVTRTTGLTSFDSDGFTTGSESGYDNSGDTFVAWNWKAGGTAVSNTDGSITSSVSASPESGFSVLTYTGPGASGGTIGHGLGKAPSMIIVKNRSAAENWRVYHSSLTATKYLNLNADGAAVTSSAVWAGTEPTASVFSIANDAAVSGSGNSLVAYCFADIDGMVKAGSYVGNGSSDGPVIFTGFRPAWVMVKRTDSTGNWTVYDDERLGYNVDNEQLYPNLSNAEGTSTHLDLLSNGFKWRTPDGSRNASGGTYIYLAFAEQPFKYANAR